MGDSKMRIKLLQTRKKFWVKYRSKSKIYVFNVIATDNMEGVVTGRVIDIKRMKYHQDDCKEVLQRKAMKDMKENIIKRFM